MKEFTEFYTTSDIIKEIKAELNKLNIDLENYSPTLVQFKNANKLFLGKKYLYLVHESSIAATNDLVLVPTYEDDNLEIAKVSDVLQTATIEFLHIVQREVAQLINLKMRNKEKPTTVREIALVIGKKDGYRLSPYFKRLEKAKRKKEIMEKLEAEAAKAQKINLYKTLSESNPEIKELLDELDKI